MTEQMLYFARFIASDFNEGFEPMRVNSKKKGEIVRYGDNNSSYEISWVDNACINKRQVRRYSVREINGEYIKKIEFSCTTHAIGYLYLINKD